jgi:hypothetical protein
MLGRLGCGLLFGKGAVGCWRDCPGIGCFLPRSGLDAGEFIIAERDYGR